MTAFAPTPFDTAPGTTKGRRILPVEEALRWMARDELPKRKHDAAIKAPPAAGMHPMWRGGIFGGRIDNWSREPGMPAAMGDPHPDALRMERAIRDLDPNTLDLTGYRITYGLERLDARIPVREILAQAVEHAKPWLLTCAVRGSLPDHGCGPIFEPHKGTRGQVTLWLETQKEVGHGADGQPWFVASHEATTPCYGGDFNPAKGSQYRKGTFCKMRFTREARDVAMDRAIYAAWHSAVCRLQAALAGTEEREMTDGARTVVRRVPILESLVIRPPAAPAEPWIEPPTPRVVRLSLVPSAEESPPERVKGERLPPRNPASPVRRIDPATYPLAA